MLLSRQRPPKQEIQKGGRGKRWNNLRVKSKGAMIFHMCKLWGLFSGAFEVCISSWLLKSTVKIGGFSSLGVDGNVVDGGILVDGLVGACRTFFRDGIALRCTWFLRDRCSLRLGGSSHR